MPKKALMTVKKYRKQLMPFFIGALASFRYVDQNFFPASNRHELMVDLWLPQGASFAATLAEAKKWRPF